MRKSQGRRMRLSRRKLQRRTDMSLAEKARQVINMDFQSYDDYVAAKNDVLTKIEILENKKQRG